jgi:hypothetical protein
MKFKALIISNRRPAGVCRELRLPVWGPFSSTIAGQGTRPGIRAGHPRGHDLFFVLTSYKSFLYTYTYPVNPGQPWIDSLLKQL